MAEGDGRIGLPELLVGVPFPTAALEVVRFAGPREKLQSLIYTRRSLSARDALMRSPFHHIETTGNGTTIRTREKRPPVLLPSANHGFHPLS
jgi:enoyl-CoA hydratase/carnithine racemase